MSGITLSKEYGVNPSVQICHCCGKDLGLILFGTHYKDKNGKVAKAPHKISTGAICEDCKNVIDSGCVFFIEVRDGESRTSPDDPYRTGRLVAIKSDAAKDIFPECQSINYLEASVFDKLFGKFVKS